MATEHYAIPEANRNSSFKTSDWNAALQKVDAEMWKLFQFRGDLGSSDNLNSLSGSGFWRIGGSAPLNSPSSGWIWCFIIQFVYGTVTVQYIIKPSGDGITMREYSGNPQVWTDWKCISGRTSISLTTTNPKITSAERKFAVQTGNVVVVDLSFTVGTEITGATEELFSGLPVPSSGFRFRLFNTLNNNTPIRLSVQNVSSVGKILNAYSTGGIPAGTYEGQAVYIAE